MKEMKKAYDRQKYNAKQRNIRWLFTFEEWRYMWESSGKWEQRGRKKHQYVMCRYNDEGPYSFYNTKIDTAANNNKEQSEIWHRENTRKEYIRIKETRGRPAGIGKSVTINGKSYSTITEASIDLNVKRTTLIYRLTNGYYN